MVLGQMVAVCVPHRGDVLATGYCLPEQPNLNLNYFFFTLPYLICYSYTAGLLYEVYSVLPKKRDSARFGCASRFLRCRVMAPNVSSQHAGIHEYAEGTLSL